MLRSGPDRVEYNRVGSSRGHKIYFFLIWSGSGKDITGHYGAFRGRGGKNLAPQDYSKPLSISELWLLELPIYWTSYPMHIMGYVDIFYLPAVFLIMVIFICIFQNGVMANQATLYYKM